MDMTPGLFSFKICNEQLLRFQLPLYVPALRKSVTLQNVKYAFFGRVIMPLAKLSEVRGESLLNLSSRLVHRFADICFTVSN